MKKFICLILSVCLLTLSLVGCSFTPPTTGNGGGNGGGNGTNPEDNTGVIIPDQQNNFVQNIKYDEQKLKITWDKFGDVESYDVSITSYFDNNGTLEPSFRPDVYRVKGTEYFFVPESEKFDVSIRAVPDYGDSSYYSPKQTFTPSSLIFKVFLSLNNILPSTNSIVEVAHIIHYDAEVRFYVKVIKDGVYSIFYIDTWDNNDFTSYTLADWLATPQNQNRHSKIIGNASKYNCANYLIRSKDYTGELQTYYENGYAIEVVSQATYKNSDFMNYPYIDIFAIYRLTKDDEVKYASTFIRAMVNNPSVTDSNNMTSILTPAKRNLSEQEFQILEGDYEEFAKQIYEKNKKD